VTSRPGTPLLAAVLAELDGADESLKRELASQLRPFLADHPGRLLDAGEKAQQLGLHPDTLVRMARAGRIPGAKKVGREWRFPADRSDVRPVATQTPASSRLLEPARAPRRRDVGRASVAAIRGRS